MNKKIKLMLAFILIMIGSLIFMNNKADAYSVGDVLSISEYSMSAAGDTYCIAHSQGFSNTMHGLNNPATFKIVYHLQIEGKTSKNDAGVEVENDANAILASILNGPLTKGYGKYTVSGNSYGQAQQALYVYWDTWVSAVGSQYGLTSFGGLNYRANAGIGSQASYYQQVAANYVSAGNVCGVDIYLLKCISHVNIQNLLIAVPRDVDTPDNPDTPTPPPEQTVDGWIEIKGKVWVDGAAGKSNTIDGKFSSGDTGLSGIKVTLRDSGGSEFAGGSSAYTDGSGNYTIRVNYKDNVVYQLYEDYETVLNKLYSGAYVDFEYDGVKYTTVNTAPYGSDTSRAMENENERISFDNARTRVTPNSNTSGAILKADTRNVIYNFKSYPDQSYVKESVPIVYCHGSGAVLKTQDNVETTYTYSNKDSHWTTTHDEIHYAHPTDHYVNDYDRPNGWEKDYSKPKSWNKYGVADDWEYDYSKPTSWEQKFDHRTFCGGHVLESTTVTKLVIDNVNLGLFEREQPDIAIASDIANVKVTMKGQEYTYIYGNKGIQTDDPNQFDATVKFQNKYTYKYSREINPADVAYVNKNEENKDDLRVQITYRFVVKNQSNTLGTIVHRLVTYSDSRYTVVSGGWTNYGSNGTYTQSISGDLNLKMDVGGSAETFVTYDISTAAIRDLIKQDATLNNVVEIYEYSTQYGDNTLCAGIKTASSIGKTGYNYAGIDVDSQPGNAGVYYDSSNNRLDVRNLQDDTDIAPSFVLCLKKVYKTISGNVWEDTDANTDDAERLGNGKKDNNEKGVQNVRAKLYTFDKDGNLKEAQLYYIQDGQPYTADASVFTDANGNFTIGNSSNMGLVVDKYIIEYTYGNGDQIRTTIDGGKTTVNARNYKSTIITNELIANMMKGTEQNTKWHLSDRLSRGISIAADDINERLKIDNLKYSTYNDKIDMMADSKPFELQVEFSENTSSQVDQNGNTGIANDLAVFDFGIIERPRENIVINKTIAKVKVTLANGQVLINGDPRSEKINYVKAPGIAVGERATYQTLDRLLSMEIDQELLQGANLEIWYAITVTNYSEIDYDYAQGTQYYLYGDNSGLNIIKQSVNLVADYMSSKLVCEVGNEATVKEDNNNNEWYKYQNSDGTTLITATTLKDNGYVSEDVEKTVAEREQQLFVTNTFANVEPNGGTKTSIIYARRELANQEENYTFDNHTEILELDGKIARTIKESNKGTQVDKEYQPGNYIPTLSSEHQQDDDRVRIVITPPTGTTAYMTSYIITGLVGAVVILIGAWFIRKDIKKSKRS